MPDLEAGERQPLLKAEERKLQRGNTSSWAAGHESRLALSMGSFGEKAVSFAGMFDKNADFAENVGLSIRAGFACVVLGLPILMPDLLDVFHHWMFKNVSWITCIVFMVFTLAPTVGASMSVAYQGMWGVFFACLNIVIMYGIYPNGTEDHPEPFSAPVWYVAAADFVILIFVFVFLNIDADFKLFACCEHCWFMMCFFNPHNTTEFSRGFELHMTGAATSEMISTFIGVNLAVLAAFLPYPVWSSDRCKKNAVTMVQTINELWDTVMDYYTGDKSSAIVYRCRREADGVHDRIVRFEKDIANMYWEGFDYGKRGCVRKQLLVLTKTLKEAHACTLVAIAFAEQEEFEEAHVELMDMMKDDFLAFRKTVRITLELAVAACLDGSLDEDEEQTLRDCVRYPGPDGRGIYVVAGAGVPEGEDAADGVPAGAEALRKASASLAFTFSQVRSKVCEKRKRPRMARELLGEHAYALSLSNYGRLTQELCDQVLETKCLVPPGERLVRDPFDREVLLSQENLSFTVRNVGSILFSFLIGFLGFPIKTGSLIQPFTPDIAVTTSLLLSAFAGSAIQKNLGRLQGVCLGTIMGQIIWVRFAWCHPVSMQIAFCFVMFLYMALTIYIFHSSVEYGYVGSLLAVFGAKAMLAGCTDVVGPVEGSGKYNSLVYVTVAILVMIMFDVVLASKRASTLAVESMLESSATLKKQMEQFFDGKQEETPEPRYHSATLDRALVAAQEAAKEPRHWRGPWHAEIMNEALECHSRIRDALLYLVQTVSVNGQVGGKKSEIALALLQTPACKAVTDHIMARYTLLFEATKVVLQNEEPIRYDKKFFEGVEQIKKVSPEAIQALLEASERIAGPKSDAMLKTDPRKVEGEQVYLHSFPICQCAVLAAQLLQISDALAGLEMKLVRHA